MLSEREMCMLNDVEQTILCWLQSAMCAVDSSLMIDKQVDLCTTKCTILRVT